MDQETQLRLTAIDAKIAEFRKSSFTNHLVVIFMLVQMAPNNAFTIAIVLAWFVMPLLNWVVEQIIRWWTSDRPKETLMEVTKDGVHHVELD